LYRNLNQAISDLEKNGQLIRITEEVDPNLQMAEIHRRVFATAGPAIFYEQVKGSPFPAVSNLFGTIERARDSLSEQSFFYSGTPCRLLKK